MINEQIKKSIYEFVQKSLDGELSDAESAILNDYVSCSENAAYYLECLRLNNALRDKTYFYELSDNNPEDIIGFGLEELAFYEKTAPAIEIPNEEPDRELIQKVVYLPREKRKITKFQIFTFIASAAAVLFMIAFPRVFPTKHYSVEVATLVDQVGATWGDSDSRETLKAGSRLWSQKGPLWLKKGTVKIEFDYGAEVIIEGPAEFELVDAEKMILDSGRLYVTVPERATGFTAVTPSATIIDLGTEFAVKVDYDGSSDVHMFKGKASLVPGEAGNKGKGVSLFAGKAKRVGTQGEVKSINLNANAFIQPAQYELMSKADKGSAYHRWLLYSQRLRRDPSLVAYYTFEKNEQRPGILENKASLTEGKLNGDLYSAINGKLPTWTTGRWPQKTALNFERSERQVVVVPSDSALHINGPITITAWVRCDDPNDGGHIVSCRLPDRGKANYQLGYDAPDVGSYWDGNIQFGRMQGTSKTQRYSKDRIFSDRTFYPLPQWRFIAATHDNKEVRLYVDGKLIEIHQFELYQEQAIAGLVIGADNISGDTLRFTGEMDELMIFSRVLSQGEIGDIYKAGKP